MDIRKNERIFQYLEKIHSQFAEIAFQLTLPEVTNQPRKLRDLSKELSRLKPMEAKFQEFRKLTESSVDLQSLAEMKDDPEMAELAKEELSRIQEGEVRLQKEVESLMVTDSSEESRNVFLEIRAGAGGDEASLFVTDLLRMYSRLSERMKWKVEIISTAYSGIGGVKEVILYIQGQNVFKYLRYEIGVHRVQRVPITESSGRIHTSTITVAVLPEVEDVEIAIDAKDIRIDTYAASGPGGQHVNKTESAIRITHFPTGIVVTCQDEKSQHKNRDKAMKVLQARLMEYEKNRQKENIDQTRKSQVGTGERSEKIRTYNFPQSRVTDHRVNSRNFNIEFILDGDLQNLIQSLHENRQQNLIEEKIKALNE